MAPKRQDTRKLIENLSGSGKSIAVLTSGGDAQGKVAVPRTSIIGQARLTASLKTPGREMSGYSFSPAGMVCVLNGSRNVCLLFYLSF